MANDNSSGGLGINVILFLIFLVLKLTNHINWSWWWVTAPLWGLYALAGVIGIVTIVIMYFKRLLKK